MASNNVQTTVTVGMDVQLAKRNANALKEVIIDLKNQLKEQRALMDNAADAEGYRKAAEAVDNLILKIKTLEKVQRSATPATAYEAFISGDVMNSNTLRQAQRGAKNRLNTVPSGASDQTARTFINDINRAQVELNRLQAGFSKPLQSVKKELRDLSGNELQRLLQLLKQEQTLVQGNDKAWAAYSAAIGKVEERIREYDTVARQQMGSATLSQSQRGGFAQANERDIQRAIDKLREYRTVIADPNGTGRATWEATTREILKLQATLDGLKAKTAEMSGQTMHLSDAYRIGFDAMGGRFKGTTQELMQAKKVLQENLGQVQRGSEAYKQLQKAILGVEMEEKRMGMTAQEIRAVLDAPKGKSFNELKIAVEQGRLELSRMRTETKEDKKTFDELAKKVKEAEFQMKELGGASKGTASSFDKAWSRLKTYIGLYMGAAVAIQKLTSTLGDLMDLSDRMGEVRKTTGFTADEVGRLSNSLAKMDTRTTLTGLMDLSVAAGQLGLKTEQDVIGFTEAANKLMVALPEMGKEGATEMLKVALATGEIAKIEKQMREGLIDGTSATAVAMEKVGSTIDRLRATSAATAPAITDFVKRVGAVGAQSGITIDQVAALGSTVDALGMRVEMSATALSRMIPAIRNNAFALANAIGVTPDVIRDLFDAGRGMEVILMVLQRMKDANMNADSIESLLGMAGMKDIMKELNQQGARAGIVFGGLSQNVDTLRKHLITAGEAYQENTAIQNEYNKMNETTAAKWERLKNQLEEFFVGDTSQRGLGVIIDGLRKIVDLLTGSSGVSVGLRAILLYIGMLRINLLGLASGALTAIGGGLKNIGVMLGFVKGQMTKLQMGNIFTALAAAVLYLVIAFRKTSAAVSAVSKAIGDLEGEFRKETETVNNLFHTVNKTNVELDRARRKLEEVKKAGDDTVRMENELKKASAAHAASIREINSKYGAYLGYMLSETSSAQQLAAARELINAKLRETITLKQKEAALGNVEQEFGGKVNKKAASTEELVNELFGENYDAAARVSVAISEAVQKYSKDSDGFRKAVQKIVKDNKAFISKNQITGVVRESARAGVSVSEDKAIEVLSGNLAVRADEYRAATEKYLKQEEAVNNRFEARTNVVRKESREKAVKTLNAAMKDWKDLLGQYQQAQGKEKERLAAEVYKQQRAYANIFANNADYFENDKRKAAFERNIKNMATYEKGLRKVAGEAIRSIDAMERAESKVTGTDYTNDGQSANNPWGDTLGAESTDWKNMTAEQLVNRRKQMNDFVNAIQTDTDVQSVLNEDKALKKAIEKGMSSDMRTVIEWYNTERLKIQEELHARHLTNTGDWLDPKKQKARKAQLQNEWKAFLDELDAYYTERSSKIQEARNNEDISEAEAWRKEIANDAEWHRRRAELQLLYANKSAEVAGEEQKAIFDIIAERTGDSADFIEKSIGKTVDFALKIRAKSEKEYRTYMGQLDKGSEQDFLRQQRAVGKQMKAIEDIINKERPFNGITENLQENLVKMGILTADLVEDQRNVVEEVKRTMFLLGEAEHAYLLDTEKLLSDMREGGFYEWADAISKDKTMQQGILAMLRSTYDAVQDAIKKEAAQIKKQVDIAWNDAILPNGMSQKQAFESTLSVLGYMEDQVKRNNSLIDAGYASERVADKLAIRQMQVRLAMQERYYAMMREQGMRHISMLKEEARLYREQGLLEEANRKEMDAQHVAKSLNLSLSEEQKKLDEQRVAIQNQLEESQNRLYKQLKEWGDLLASSLQTLFEAWHTGEPEYYNERAKLNLTGKGGPGAGTYVVIDNAGRSGATAHYEYLDERGALERQREIERQNAMADAWKKVMDDINMKLSETITDQLNALLQNANLDANTTAVNLNTEALGRLTEQLAGGVRNIGAVTDAEGFPVIDENNPQTWGRAARKRAGLAVDANPHDHTQAADPAAAAQAVMDASDAVTQNAIANSSLQTQVLISDNKKAVKSTQSSFAAMTAAANMYGIAYQAMSNENLSTAQKVEMMIVQAAGQAAISMLTASMAASTGETAANAPAWVSKTLKELGPIGGPVAVGVFTALIGGLMGMAMSKISKAKSEIAQATGASSVNAGRLTTGMLAYAEGNVNEFTDPSTLREGRQYNVDAADGRTYRARYMGRNPRTHLTNGPEFHLSGEKGREMIIDAGTTRQITMNDGEIWRTIQTLSAGGRMRRARRGRGVAAFAEGNIGDFEDYAEQADYAGASAADIAAMQASLDRNSAVQEALLERLRLPIKAVVGIHGPDGVVAGYDKGKKEAVRHGERY